MIRTEDYKRELISIVFAQKHLIFWTAFLIFAGAVAVAFFWPPTYSATGSVLLTAKQLMERDPLALQNAETRAFSISKEELSSELQILNSPQTVTNALATLAGKHPSLRLEGKDAAVATVSEVIGNLKVKVVPSANVIEVQYLNRNPELAVEILDALMDEYLAQRSKLYARRPQPPAKIFADEAERYKEGIRSKDEELVALLSETGAAEPRVEIEANIRLKKQLELELNALKKEQVDVKLSVAQIEKTLVGNEVQFFSYIENPSITNFGQRIAALVRERDDLLRIYQPQQDIVISLNDQIAENMTLLRKEIALVKDSLAKKLQVISTQISDLEAQIAWYNDKNVAMGEQLISTQRILRETEVMKSSYETYAKRTDEVAINNTLASNEPSISAKILNSAFPSKGPVFPKQGVVLPLGLLVGLLSGCSLGFVREYFDHSFKKPSDVTAYAGLPVLFSLSRPSNRTLDMLYSLVIAALVIGTGVFVALKM